MGIFKAKNFLYFYNKQNACKLVSVSLFCLLFPTFCIFLPLLASFINRVLCHCPFFWILYFFHQHPIPLPSLYTRLNSPHMYYVYSTQHKHSPNSPTTNKQSLTTLLEMYTYHSHSPHTLFTHFSQCTHITHSLVFQFFILFKNTLIQLL